ncbi:unnamed protein product [Tenebrio molitor]|nr:unnamed protein product [Tenebrio molitor]
MHAIKELKKEVRKIQNYKKSINPQCGCFSRRRRFVIVHGTFYLKYSIVKAMKKYI